MAPFREISEVVRAQILILKKEGYSTRKIAKKLNIFQTGVTRTIKRLLTTGSFRSRHRSGRPKSTNLRVDHMIRRMVVANPSISASEIRSQLAQHMKKVPCVQTI